MSCILDIDLDYFRLVDRPVRRLREILAWADRPVSSVHERHHHAFLEWRHLVQTRELETPHYIIHVDEHHDMMDDQETPNLANVMFQAMRVWTSCRVYWLTSSPIDSPAMWLSEETWAGLKKRFTIGEDIPEEWPRPDLVSVVKNDEFIYPELASELLEVIDKQAGYASGTD